MGELGGAVGCGGVTVDGIKMSVLVKNHRTSASPSLHRRTCGLGSIGAIVSQSEARIEHQSQAAPSHRLSPVTFMVPAIVCFAIVLLGPVEAISHLYCLICPPVIFINCLEPATVVVRVTDDVHVEKVWVPLGAGVISRPGRHHTQAKQHQGQT